MTTKQIVIAFLVLYLILIGVGATMYYTIVNVPKNKAQTVAQSEATQNDGKVEINETDKNKSDKAVKKRAAAGNATASAKQTEKKPAKAELSEEQLEKEREWLRKLKTEIESKLNVITRGGATFYTSKWDKESSGVHLRPFIAEKNGTVILKHDIYYYSALDDANYGWIHGTNLEVDIDGEVFAYELDASKRRDKLGKGAEDLTEHYVMDADKNVETMLKAVGNASKVTVHYYGEADTTAVLSREDIRRINEIITMYEILEKEANGEM